MAIFEDRVFLAAVDCTGHGVPGAFMSVVGHNILNQVVSDLGISRPEAILKAVDRRIGQLLHQHFGNPFAEASLDGMDLALVVLHPPAPDGHRVVEYAGAGRPLWVWDGQHLAEYRSGRYPCGGGQQPDKSYPSHRLTLSPGSRLYLGSDGITDQFGGEAGRKLGSRRLLDWLQHSMQLSIAEQGQALAQFLEAWQGERRQIDDLLLIGLELGGARSS
jgi:serine phosphatase RsbU (regulator of sigma subunit)